MAAEYLEALFDYRVDGDFTTWLEARDNDDGFELVVCFRDTSNYVNQHIIRCIFRKKL